MNKVLSLKLKADIFNSSEKIIHRLNIPRNTYINQAVMFYNTVNQRQLLKKQLSQESQLVRQNSADYLALLEQLDDVIVE